MAHERSPLLVLSEVQAGMMSLRMARMKMSRRAKVTMAEKSERGDDILLSLWITGKA